MVNSDEEVKGKIWRLLCSDLYIDEVSMTDRLIEDLNMDSLDKLEIGVDIEEEFDIEIGVDDFDDVKTVQDIIDFVNKKVEEK